MKTRILVLLLTLTGASASAQLSEEVSRITPEFPFDIYIDFGFNVKEDSASSWLRSRSFGLYMAKSYDLSSKMQFRAGLGWNSEKIAIQKSEANDIEIDDYIDPVSSIEVGYLRDFKMAINYIDIPVELRYNFSGNDLTSWFVAVGGSIAYRIESHSKISFINEQNQTVKMKIRGNNGFTELNDLRYGVQARAGYGIFNIFYKQYFSDLYTSADGNYFTIGVSLAGF